MPSCSLLTPGRASCHPESRFPSRLLSCPCQHPFRRQHSNRYWDGQGWGWRGSWGAGVGEVPASQRTRLKGDRSRWGTAPARGLPCGGQALDFEHSPSQVHPAAPRLGAVSMPALMCHVSSRASRGCLSESCQTVFVGIRLPPPRAPPCSPVPAPQGLALWGESGTNR